MGEREKGKESIGKGELVFLGHPGTNIFSGYGLTLNPDRVDYLAGLLMVDRPAPVDPEWLKQVEDTFGECQLVPMTVTGERGIVCRMQIEPESQEHLQQFTSMKTSGIKSVLTPLLDESPKPIFRMRWDEEHRVWQSRIAFPNELPGAIREVLENFGYGCLAVEADIGVVHVCHAADSDIDGFANKPVISRWQLIEMPTAPLIRLELVLLDRPGNPFRFESFLNVAEEDQANVLAQLANQERLYLAFYGDDLGYRFTKIISHDKQQWQQIDELTMEANEYWNKIPTERRDFDQAKAEFLR